LRAACAFGHQDRLGGAVQNVGHALGAVYPEHPLVIARDVTGAAGGINHASGNEFGVDSEHTGIVPTGGIAVE
jgi:hypothetical protein